ncbi:MAG: zf-HC2 domain-containing protein [Pseudomonadota bacterium]
MNCPNLLVHTLYADGELDDEQTTAFETHMSQCNSCQARHHAVEQENKALRTALHTDAEALTVPQLITGPSASTVLLTIALVIASGMLIDTAWQKLGIVVALPAWLSWLAPSFADTAFTALDYFADALRSALANGSPSIQTLLWWLLPAGLLFALANRELVSRAPTAGLMLCAALSLGYPSESSALDIRHSEDNIIVAAAEVIDDTVIIAAERVIIDGDITGDLIAAGEKVTIRSKIGGNIIVLAEELEIESAINGTVFALGESIAINETGIEGNLFLAGEKVRNDTPFVVGGNILLAAKDAELGAQIGRELWAAASSLTFSGKTAKDLRYYGGELELSGTAQVGGDFRVMIADEPSLRIDDNAVIAGERSIDTIPEETSEHSVFDYLFERFMRLLAAFLFGLALYWLLPSLRFASALDGKELLGSSALGAVALITTPLLAFLLMFTLIGLPIGIAALFLWVIAIYASHIVASAYVGDAIFANAEQNRPIVALFLGLLILFALTSIPFVGPAVRLIAFIVGLGIIVRWARDAWFARDYPA